MKTAHSDIVIALTTTDSQESADKIADFLVREHVVACVNILPGVKSVYFWQGKVVSDQEFLLVMKTTRARAETIKSRLSEIHHYDVPELVLLPVIDGLPAYLNWVEETVNLPKPTTASD